MLRRPGWPAALEGRGTRCAPSLSCLTTRPSSPRPPPADPRWPPIRSHHVNNFFGDDFVVPTFSDAEPGDGQRWSTWPAITPSERGPQPWPACIVTSAAAADTELGILRTGKEADVFLLGRAVPDEPAQTVLRAAKRYRSAERSDFHRSSVYREGRIERRSRDQRAVERGTAYGRSVAAVAWSY